MINTVLLENVNNCGFKCQPLSHCSLDVRGEIHKLLLWFTHNSSLKLLAYCASLIVFSWHIKCITRLALSLNTISLTILRSIRWTRLDSPWRDVCVWTGWLDRRSEWNTLAARPEERAVHYDTPGRFLWFRPCRTLLLCTRPSDILRTTHDSFWFGSIF